MSQNYWLSVATWSLTALTAWGMGATYNAFFNPVAGRTAFLYQKKVALLDQETAPQRLLLVGGSATHFGVDARQVEQGVHIPTYNLGLHAGLGLDAILGSVVGHIRPGDRVLLFPEYELLSGNDGNFNSNLASTVGLLRGNPATGESTPREIIYKTLLAGTPGMNAVTRNIRIQLVGANPGYTTDISERGDAVVMPKGRPNPTFVQAGVSTYAYRRLQQFRTEVEAKGGRLMFALPWVLAQRDEPSLTTVEAIATTLSEIAPVFYDPATLNLYDQPELFSDTNYHLSEQGRQVRSQALIQQLRPSLQNNP